MTPAAGSGLADRLVWRKPAAALLLAGVLVGFTARITVYGGSERLTPDSFHYLLLARSLASGGGFVSGGSQHPDLCRPPLLPLAIAALTPIAGGVEQAGLLLVDLAGALVVVPLFFLARRLFGNTAALAALPLGSLTPLLGTSSRLLPTSLHLLLVVAASAAAIEAAAATAPAARRGLLASAGALAGLAALARAEAIVFAPAIALWAALDVPRQPPAARARRALLVLGAALLVYGPYAAWASQRLGRLSPAPGVEYLQALRHVGNRLGLRYVEGEPVSWTERALYLPNAAGTGFVLDTYFRTGRLEPALREETEPSGATDVTEPRRPRRTRWERWRAKTQRTWAIFQLNTARVPHVLRRSRLIPLVLCGLVVLGVAAGLLHRAGRRGALFSVFLGVVSLAPLISHVEWRFLYGGLAAAALLAAGGWGALDRALPPRPRLLRFAIHAAVLLALAVSGVRHSRVQDPSLRTDYPPDDVVAAASRTEVGPILSVRPALAWFAGRPYRAVPIGDVSDVLAYARSQGARALFLDGSSDLHRRPRLRVLLEQPPPPGLRLLLERPGRPDRRGHEAAPMRLFAIDPVPGGSAR